MGTLPKYNPFSFNFLLKWPWGRLLYSDYSFFFSWSNEDRKIVLTMAIHVTPTPHSKVNATPSKYKPNYPNLKDLISATNAKRKKKILNPG